MNEIQFWKLYNMLYNFYPEKGKTRKHGTQDNTSANDKIHLFLHLSIVICYFTDVPHYDLMVSNSVWFSDVYYSVLQMVDTIHL